MSEESIDNAIETKTREPKKNSIPTEKVSELTTGLPQYEKTSFLVVGHKDGVRLALPKTNGISRAYFYGDGDYASIPTHDAISVFTEDQRKQRRLGGIMAEVDFEKGIEKATEALAALVEVVRNAPVPAPKGVKPVKEPKPAKKAKADVDVADAMVAPSLDSARTTRTQVPE